MAKKQYTPSGIEFEVLTGPEETSNGKLGRVLVHSKQAKGSHGYTERWIRLQKNKTGFYITINKERAYIEIPAGFWNKGYAPGTYLSGEPCKWYYCYWISEDGERRLIMDERFRGLEDKKEEEKAAAPAKKQTTVIIGNVFKKEIGERKVARLKALTLNSFYNFEFAVYPIGGSFNIQASSDYDFEGDPEKEMLSILLQYLVLEF